MILYNLNTHKPEHDRWLARQPNVQFHYTPTHASWMSLIEVWLSLLARFALRPRSFTHPRQVRQAIGEFTQAHNEQGARFEWTKRTVRQNRLRNKYAYLCN